MYINIYEKLFINIKIVVEKSIKKVKICMKKEK